MESRRAKIGTGVALAGLAGLAAAAVTIGAPESATPLQPAADTVATQTQTPVVRTVVHGEKQSEAEKGRDRRTVVRPAAPKATAARAASAPTAPVAQPAPATVAPARSSGGSDDGPNHDVGDDHGGRGEVETGDDHGGDRGEVEPGDDHSGRGRGGDSRDD